MTRFNFNLVLIFFCLTQGVHMDLEEHKASEEMKKFFENLLEIKAFVKTKHEETNDPTLKEIYERLDKVIKIK